MPLPPTILTAQPRRHRKRAAVPAVSPPPPPPPPPVLGPVLTAAVFDATGYVDLTFDRPINIDGIQPNNINVTQDNEGGGTSQYLGVGSPVLLSEVKVRVDQIVIGAAEEPGSTLTATAENGIVAVEDGQPWAGVTRVGLPFA